LRQPRRKFLASLEDEATVITTDLAFFELANELKYLPGFADNNYSLLLVDLHNFLHRSYHALPERLDDKANVITLVHAVDALIKWIEASKYSHVAFCSDSKTNLRKEYTEELFPNDQNRIYKGNRKYNDENLKKQINDAEKYIAQKGYKVIAVQGYEADDVIASFVKEFDKPYLKFKKLQSRSGKEFSEIHSGNLNEIRLPAKLAEFCFLRKEIE